MSKIDFSQLVTAEDKAAQEQAAATEAIRSAARAYLAETDWYVTRQIETGKAVPKAIAKKRKAAREVGPQ